MEVEHCFDQNRVGVGRKGGSRCHGNCSCWHFVDVHSRVWGERQNDRLADTVSVTFRHAGPAIISLIELMPNADHEAGGRPALPHRPKMVCCPKGNEDVVSDAWFQTANESVSKFLSIPSEQINLINSFQMAATRRPDFSHLGTFDGCVMQPHSSNTI